MRWTLNDVSKTVCFFFIFPFTSLLLPSLSIIDRHRTACLSILLWFIFFQLFQCSSACHRHIQMYQSIQCVRYRVLRQKACNYGMVNKLQKKKKKQFGKLKQFGRCPIDWITRSTGSYSYNMILTMGVRFCLIITKKWTTLWSHQP